MRFHVPSTALGLALVAAAPAANAQAVITREIVQPVQTVQTTETIRTVRPALRTVRRQIVTTRTITRRVVPAPTVVARTVTTVPQPLYDEVAPAPIAAAPQPLYDEVLPPPAVPAPAVGTTPVAQDSYTEPFIYRYVYEPDRILVVDPNTGIAVQAIPR